MMKSPEETRTFYTRIFLDSLNLFVVQFCSSDSFACYVYLVFSLGFLMWQENWFDFANVLIERLTCFSREKSPSSSFWRERERELYLFNPESFRITHIVLHTDTDIESHNKYCERLLFVFCNCRGRGVNKEIYYQINNQAFKAKDKQNSESDLDHHPRTSFEFSNVGWIRRINRTRECLFNDVRLLHQKRWSRLRHDRVKTTLIVILH